MSLIGNGNISNPLGEVGKAVDQGVEYNSGTNSNFLSLAEIVEYNNRT